MPAAGKLIRNERVKLLAGAFNAVGLAFAIGGFVAPILSGEASYRRVALGFLALGVGAMLHGFAQAVLGRLHE